MSISKTSSRVLFSDLSGVLSPLSSTELIPLDDPAPARALGRFSETLLLNDSVAIPIKGPALEVVALIRWFGEAGLLGLVESGVLSFVFCSGDLTFILEVDTLSWRRPLEKTD